MKKSKSYFFEILQDFISLFYPEQCYGCGRLLVKNERILCTFCLCDMPLTDYHLYPDNILKYRFAGRVPLDHALAFFKFRKKGMVQRILHTLKYQDQPKLGIALGEHYGAVLNETKIPGYYDLIVPVPLHHTRLRQRGYNQSLLWAQGISKITGIPVEENALLKKMKTGTQTKRSRLLRWKNVETVFYVKNSNLIAGKKILLADDVVTTGATLEACAEQLLAAGARSVGIVCIAEA